MFFSENSGGWIRKASGVLDASGKETKFALLSPSALQRCIHLQGRAQSICDRNRNIRYK
jgi:hypothetical protein